MNKNITCPPFITFAIITVLSDSKLLITVVLFIESTLPKYDNLIFYYFIFLIFNLKYLPIH